MGKTEKNRKENHAIEVTKIPKTKRQKYGLNETLMHLYCPFLDGALGQKHFCRSLAQVSFH